MANEVWVRGYAEAYGATVEYDAETGEVIIEGVRITPSFVTEKPEGGYAYVPKEVVDKILEATGKKSPYEFDTAIEEQYRYEATEEQLRTTTASRGIRDFINRYNLVAIGADAFERAKAWVLEHIWKPVSDWWDNATAGVGRIWTNIFNIPSSILTAFNKIKVKFSDIWNNLTHYADSVSDWVYGHLLEFVKGTVEYVEYIKNRLNVIITDWWGKLEWYTSSLWQDIKCFFDNPIESVANLIVIGFSYWWNKVEILIETYIVDHWEDEI